jgi:RNA polymerase sigma-70 factor (ECF subfamily)
MEMGRDNEAWIRDLRSGGGDQAKALESLRSYLLRVLPGSLRRYGPVPEHLLDDLVQDALLRVLDRLEDFEGRSRFTTWVTTIAVRTALTELRRRRWKDVSLSDVALADGFDPGEPSGDEADPESQAARRGVVRALGSILEERLSERQRGAIVAELRGMPQAEIGRRLGISRNAVYKLTHDARKKLKAGLEDSGFDAAEIRAAFS